ncbi:Uncharacterised protein [Vibrio cholerae]|nr:Uncharacterised protein [Vibrio cholerae]
MAVSALAYRALSTHQYDTLRARNALGCKD